MSRLPPDSIDIDDRRVFSALIDEYYGPVLVFAMRTIGNSHIAEDMVQDAFASLWAHRGKVNDRIYARNYLYTVVRNSTVDYFRALKKQHKGIEYHIPASEDFSADFIRAETLKLLHDAVETLSPRTAQVMKFSLDGMKQDEIAEQMGITVATVKSLKADGVNKLKKLLGPAAWLLLCNLQ